MRLPLKKFDGAYRLQSQEALRKEVLAQYPEYPAQDSEALFNFCIWDCERLGIASEQGIEAHVLASFHIGEPISNCPDFDDMHAYHKERSGSPDIVSVAFLEKMLRDAELV